MFGWIISKKMFIRFPKPMSCCDATDAYAHRMQVQGVSISGQSKNYITLINYKFFFYFDELTTIYKK